MQRPCAQMAAAAAASGVETVVVTSSKIKGDIQTVPIAITALSQEQLTSRQIAGGPDLVKEVPNLTFSKTNFSGYTIQIRGIGTQAISVTTDPAVAVALNDIPFIRNHFFEQEFYDVNQVEVVRGPQGTLYGRNATAGVVNVISAKPTDQFEAMLSADFGNYTNRRYEGMVNIPIVDDRLDLRVAGEWTKRDGYTINENTGNPVDGRDLWSTPRHAGLEADRQACRPISSGNISAKTTTACARRSNCAKRTARTNNPAIRAYSACVSVASQLHGNTGISTSQRAISARAACRHRCIRPMPSRCHTAIRCPMSWQGGSRRHAMKVIDPYARRTQSRNLRDIQTQIDPRYIAKNDTLEFNADYNVTPTLTFTSQTGYNNDYPLVHGRLQSLQHDAGHFPAGHGTGANVSGTANAPISSISGLQPTSNGRYAHRPPPVDGT